MMDILSARILIVDDEMLNVALLEQVLEISDYTNVHSVTDPRRVVDMHLADPFDLILLDIRMPHLSGIDVMNLLKQATGEQWLPILVLTAQTDDQTRQGALEAGARDFVNKPFKQWEVLLRIRNLLETSLLYKRQKNRAAELEQLVRLRTEELEQTQLRIIERLGRAGEYRDNETGAHVLRMSRACRLLALAAGLPPDLAQQIEHASPMHDVGKIGIPDSVLLKQGRLDPDERKIIETHVEIGADIIGEHSSELLTMARAIAQTHHEKWDGTGYPNGLAGEQIPIESRIAAICDVFDALTSSRPYKKAWSIEDAVGLIQREAGSHFDPRLVEVFVSIVPQVVALREQYPDD